MCTEVMCNHYGPQVLMCSFTLETLLRFHEHIPQCKSDGSSHQCQECGLGYTSHVSLSQHLFIVHKLKE
ncbi:hypothetical protein CB1_090020002 [Camelus ferus]|nr:hypothetical protein CB1_090020002 [Camelus ferus]